MNAPEGRDTNFTREDFIKRNNEELSDVLGNLCHRVFTFAERYLEAKVPDGVANDSRAKELLATIGAARDRWRELLEGYRIRDAFAVVIGLAREGNRAFDAAEPWRTRKEDLERCALDVGAFLELVHALGVLILPYLPDCGQKLLGLKRSLVSHSLGRMGCVLYYRLKEWPHALNTPSAAPPVEGRQPVSKPKRVHQPGYPSPSCRRQLAR